MDKRDAIKKILSLSEAQGGDMMNASNGVGWMGQSSGIQQQLHDAIRSWTEHDDPSEMQGVVEMLRTLSMVTDDEAAELRSAIKLAQGRTKRA